MEREITVSDIDRVVWITPTRLRACPGCVGHAAIRFRAPHALNTAMRGEVTDAR